MQEQKSTLDQLPQVRGEVEDISINEILNTLWLRKRLFISATLLVVFLSALIIFQLTPKYQASSKVLIGNTSPKKIADLESVLAGNFIGVDTVIVSQIEILKSRALARKVIISLNLDTNEEFNSSLKSPGILSVFNFMDMIPEQWASILGVNKKEVEKTEEEIKQEQIAITINGFLSRLDVEQIQHSQVVNISFESEDPKMAAKIVNELSEKYIVGQLEAKFEATRKATNWLNNQLTELKLLVEDSEKAVENYRLDKGLVEGGAKIGLSEQQLSEINSQLIIARTERAEVEARYRQVQRIIKTGGDIGSVSNALSSTLIQSLHEEQASLQRKYTEMSVELGNKHPRMRKMRAELSDLKNTIKTELKKIAAGLKNDAEVASTRENSIRRSLKELEERTGGNRQDEVALHSLEREAAANKNLFETFLARFKKSTTTQGMEEPDARIISPAEIPLQPSFPNKKLLIFVSSIGGTIFSFILIFILELLNPGIRTPEQVEEKLKIPTLGVIPVIKEKSEPHDYILENPYSSLGEAVNSLRVSLMLLSPDSRVKTVLITSALPSEGKSTLSLLLARMSASSGQNVVLINTDFRRPSIEKTVGIDKNHLGLTDVLMNRNLAINNNLFKQAVDEALYHDEKSGLKILSKGQAKYVNPADLFASHRMGLVIEHLKNDYDLIILDSAPVLSVTDSRLLSSIVDKTLFVIHWDKTPSRVVKAALNQLTQYKADTLAGVVLQKVDLKQYGRFGSGESGHYYHHGHYDDYYVS